MAKGNHIVHLACQTCNARHASVFKNLRGEELAKLNDIKGCRHYKKEQMIFNEGSHSNGIYCINNGKVKIFKRTYEGKEHIVGFAKSGDILGYRDLLAGDPYTSSSSVMEDSIVCFLPRSSIFSLIKENPSLGMKFMNLLCNNLKDTQDQMIDMSHKTVKQRLAETLLLLKETYGFEEDGETLNIRLTRNDLANYVGTASESVIRLLYEFKKNGWIELDGQKIIFKKSSSIVETTGVYI